MAKVGGSVQEGALSRRGGLYGHCICISICIGICICICIQYLFTSDFDENGKGRGGVQEGAVSRRRGGLHGQQSW